MQTNTVAFGEAHGNGSCFFCTTASKTAAKKDNMSTIMQEN